MTANQLVENVEGLVQGMKGSNKTPPFSVTVPYGTNLKQQFIDGQDDLGTLEERLLRIVDVREVKVGGDSGVSIEEYVK